MAWSAVSGEAQWRPPLHRLPQTDSSIGADPWWRGMVRGLLVTGSAALEACSELRAPAPASGAILFKGRT